MLGEPARGCQITTMATIAVALAKKERPRLDCPSVALSVLRLQASSYLALVLAARNDFRPLPLM
jgi:hypothetical protein